MVTSGHFLVPSTVCPGDMLEPVQAHRISKYLRDARYTLHLVLRIAYIFPPTGLPGEHRLEISAPNDSAKIFPRLEGNHCPSLEISTLL